MSVLSTNEIVKELNHVFAEEIEAALRYLHLLSAIRGMDRLVVQPVLKEAFDETIQHAQIIAQKIRTLGGVPAMKISVDLSPEPVNGKDALRIALTFEEAALEAYQDMLRRVEGDVGLEEFVRSQIATESQHVAELKELID